jgi:hypothetical protein
VGESLGVGLPLSVWVAVRDWLGVGVGVSEPEGVGLPVGEALLDWVTLVEGEGVRLGLLVGGASSML